MKTNAINSVADRASRFVELAQDEASDLVDQGSDALHNIDKEAHKAIKANPYPAIGIAFGVGLALGFLLTPRSE